MATIAVRNKVISIGHFPPNLCFLSLQSFFFVKLHKELLYVLIVLKIRKKKDWARWGRWAKILKITQTDGQLCSITCFLECACLNIYQNILSFILYKINELDYLKTLSKMSSYAHKHIFLYLHAQTNIDTLFYWSYLKS